MNTNTYGISSSCGIGVGVNRVTFDLVHSRFSRQDIRQQVFVGRAINKITDRE